MTDEPLLAGRTENLPAIEYDQFEEPTRVITVRLPCSLHDALKAAAHDARVSLNSFCISKLIAPIEACRIIESTRDIYAGRAKRLRELNAADAAQREAVTQ